MICGALNHLNNYGAATLDPRSLRICYEMVTAQKKHVRVCRSELRALQRDDTVKRDIEDFSRDEVECNEALARIETELASRGLEVT